MSRRIVALSVVSIFGLLFIPQTAFGEDTARDNKRDLEEISKDPGRTSSTEGGKGPAQNFLSATQTNWSGGPGIPGPVNSFGNRFHTQSNMDYSHNGYITNAAGEQFTTQNKYTMAVRLSYTDIADFGGSSNHFDYFIAFESAEWSYISESFHIFNIIDHDNINNNFVGENGDVDAPIGATAIADFNNDSANDFAVIVEESNNYHLRLYTNTDTTMFDSNGRNSFFDFSDQDDVYITASDYYNTGNRAGLIAADSGNGSIDLFREVTGILVQQRNISSTLLKPGSLASAGFDDDGDIDFVCGSTNGGGIKCYSNDGQINVNFSENTVDAVGTVHDIYASDIDHDGNPDIVTLISEGNYHYLAWYRYNGSSSGFASGISISDDYAFTDKSRVASTPSQNGLAPDICLTLNEGTSTSYRVTYFKNDGSGNFPNEYIITDGDAYPEPVSVEFGDYDDDGTRDLITCSSDFDGSGHGTADVFIQDLTPYENAELVSSVYNTYQGGNATIYGDITYTLSAGSNPDYCKVYCRGSHNPDMSGAQWHGPLEDGDYLGNHQGFYSEEQYIQYKVVLNAPADSDPPVRFEEISVEYDPSGAPGVPRISSYLSRARR